MLDKASAFCLLLVASVHSVPRPPSIVIQPIQDVYYKPGETFELTYKAEGSPEPTYAWKHTNIDISSDDRISELANGTIIFNIAEGRDLLGHLWCHATNAYGTAVSNTIFLHEAYLKDFDIRADTRYYPQLGTPLTLNCVPPESEPRSQISWVIRKGNGDFQNVNYDARVTMDLEYRLRFTHVVESDGASYVCSAYNSFLNRTTFGPQFSIHVQGSEEELRPAEYMWANPEDHFGLRGSDLSLKCIFSGNPTPEVHWVSTDGSPLPGSARFRVGMEMIIENLQFEDAGVYRCLATNNGNFTRVSRYISVRVESTPFWIVKPGNVESKVGGTAEFKCLAMASPLPTFFWYINGIQMNDVVDPRITPDRFHRPEPDRIVFTNLTEEDLMVVQCNVTNKHGGIWADMYLTVLSEATTTVQPPEQTAETTTTIQSPEQTVEDTSSGLEDMGQPGLLYYLFICFTFFILL